MKIHTQIQVVRPQYLLTDTGKTVGPEDYPITLYMEADLVETSGPQGEYPTFDVSEYGDVDFPEYRRLITDAEYDSLVHGIFETYFKVRGIAYQRLSGEDYDTYCDSFEEGVLPAVPAVTKITLVNAISPVLSKEL